MKVQKRIQNDVAFVVPYGMLIGGSEIESLDKILVKYDILKTVVAISTIKIHDDHKHNKEQ